MLSSTWVDLFGFSGFLNPFALLIGGYLGWKADSFKKFWIAGFAAAALSLFLEVLLGMVHLPQPFFADAGALAMFPFRFVGGLLACALVYLVKQRRSTQ